MCEQAREWLRAYVNGCVRMGEYTARMVEFTVRVVNVHRFMRFPRTFLRINSRGGTSCIPELKKCVSARKHETCDVPECIVLHKSEPFQV